MNEFFKWASGSDIDAFYEKNLKELRDSKDRLFIDKRDIPGPLMRRKLEDKNIYEKVLIQFSTLVLHKNMHKNWRGRTKSEFERLKLVGDAAINFCVVFDIFLSMGE